MKPLIARRQQNLTLNEPPNIPLIYVDPTRITQVLVNLLSNASKYSPMETTIKLTLEIQEPDFLRVAIADRGPGISPVERSNLFRRFVRLGDHQETQYGVGLGLSVVKTIVEEHSGKVGVDERPDGGSVFWFTLPLNGDM
jgi:signal transduction histidine kinase